jgi:hypothetical protein
MFLFVNDIFNVNVTAEEIDEERSRVERSRDRGEIEEREMTDFNYGTERKDSESSHFALAINRRKVLIPFINIIL